MGDIGFALLVALTAALAAVFLVLLGAVVLRHCWRRRCDAVAPPARRRGFVLFDVCFADDDRQRRAPSSSMERSRGRRAAGERREHAPRGGGGEAAAADDDDDDQVEPDELEIARWKKIFGGPNRSLSTIDEGTEKGGTTPITTPAFCTPPASPDRRDARARARALDVETIAVQVHQA